MIALVKPSILPSNSELLGGGGTYRVDQNKMKKVRQFKSIFLDILLFLEEENRSKVLYNAIKS